MPRKWTASWPGHVEPLARHAAVRLAAVNLAREGRANSLDPNACRPTDPEHDPGWEALHMRGLDMGQELGQQGSQAG